MVQRTDDEPADDDGSFDPSDDDERVGEAIEAYLAWPSRARRPRSKSSPRVIPS